MAYLVVLILKYIVQEKKCNTFLIPRLCYISQICFIFGIFNINVWFVAYQIIVIMLVHLVLLVYTFVANILFFLRNYSLFSFEKTRFTILSRIRLYSNVILSTVKIAWKCICKNQEKTTEEEVKSKKYKKGRLVRSRLQSLSNYFKTLWLSIWCCR